MSPQPVDIGDLLHNQPLYPALRMVLFGLLSIAANLESVDSTVAGPLPAVDREQPALRRPADMALLSDGETLAVVNRLTGTLSLIDLTAQTVQGEYRVGQDLRGCVALPHQRLAVVDFRRQELIIVSCLDAPQIEQRVAGVAYPVDVQATADGTTLIVCSLWSHSACLWRRTADSGTYELAQSIDLGYPPGRVLVAPEGPLAIIADAFDGELTALELTTSRTIGRTTLKGHNIRGLAFYQGRLLLSQQLLHAHVPTTADEIAAGTVIENLQRDIELLPSPKGDIEFRPRSQGELGTPSEGAADPAGIAIAASGERFIALSGLNDVALLNEVGSVRQRPDVGEHPTEVLYDPRQDQIYVLNEFSDSVSVLHVSKRRAIREIQLGIQGTRTAAQRGEELFFNGRLGRFGWMSCHSCHPQGHQIQARADTLGDDSYGAPKRVLSLLGGRDNNPWSWTGKQRSLHEQVFKSLNTTMHGERVSARGVNDLVAYMHTLNFPPPLLPVTPTDQEQVERGRWVFKTQGCQRCHIPPLTYTSDGTFDVDLEDELGQHRFNPPSLRGVSQRRGYFHDLRARTLTDVFAEHGHQLQSALSDAELADLLRFLRSL